MSEQRRYRMKPIVVTARIAEHREVIPTLEGPLVASPGDYVITGVKGEQYPCKPDIFEATYDPVGEEE